MKRILASLASTGLNILLCSGGFTQTPTYSNVDYVGNGNVKQMLDVYIPPNTTTFKPLVIFIHGGGWSGGNKGSNDIPFFIGMYNAGYICADINYRLSGDSVFPSQIFDCKTAVRFLKTHASQYFIDTCKVGVMGMSAGGHLADLLGTSFGVDSLEGRFQGSTSRTSKVFAVVSLYGIVDFLSADSQMPITCVNPVIHDSPTAPETFLLGCQISICPYRSAKANPITYLDAGDAPFYLTHGSADCTVPSGQSNEFYNALVAANVNASVTIVPNKTHADPFFVTAPQETLYLNFFNSNGELMLERFVGDNAKNIELDISDLSNGIYFVKMNGVVRRWVKM